MLARICYQKLKIHLSPSTLVLSIKNSFQFSKTRDMIYIVNYANSLYRLSAHRWSLSHFLFHTFAFTLSLQVVCPRWSLSLSHLHFHTFTPSHFLTLSHFLYRWSAPRWSRRENFSSAQPISLVALGSDYTYLPNKRIDKLSIKC